MFLVFEMPSNGSVFKSPILLLQCNFDIYNHLKVPLHENTSKN